MNDLFTRLSQLRRPRLLIRAARWGQTGYSRERHLSRLIGADMAGRCSRKELDALFEEETVMEAKRKAGDASYSIARHIELLVALLAEARQAQATGN